MRVSLFVRYSVAYIHCFKCQSDNRTTCMLPNYFSQALLPSQAPLRCTLTTHTSRKSSSAKLPVHHLTTATITAVSVLFLQHINPISRRLTPSPGTAISLSRQPNACDNQGFKTNYANCLQCAGPDNYNIWRMYGRTLSTAGSSCGLPTEPLSGKQSDVGPAVHDGGASSTAASATPASATAASTSVSQAVMPSTSQPVVQSSITGAPTASGNATGSFTSVSDVHARDLLRTVTNFRVVCAASAVHEWGRLCWSCGDSWCGRCGCDGRVVRRI
jgi:hypothetical protein